MAYSRTKAPGCPLAVDPGVISTPHIDFLSTTTELQMDVPWDNVKLAFAQSTVTEALPTSTGMIEFRLNSNAGTLLGTINIASEATAGTKTDMTGATDNVLTDSDVIYVVHELATAGAGTEVGEADVRLYFEPQVA